MPNRLEKAILEHRAAIRSIDRAALGNVLNEYEKIMARLNPQIELLVQTLATKGELTPSELFRLDRYQELQRQIAEEMRTLATATGDITAQAQARAIQEAVTSAENMAVSAARGTSATATVATSWVNVPTKAVEDFIGASRSGPLAELLASFEDVTGRAMVDQITNALATGTNPRAVADAIVKSTDIGRNRALTIARTEMMRASRGATLAQYEENADILQGWIWSCAKSDNTCAACLAMDGTTHPQGETMDSHVNCRCSPIPWLKDIPMRPTESGAQWLEKQDAETQDRILGKAGGEAYRAGEVKLDDFVKVTNSQDWGKSISDGGVGFARMNASSTAPPIRGNSGRIDAAQFANDDEAVSWRKSTFPEWKDKYSDEQLDAITDYRSSGYKPINTLLREDEDAVRKMLRDEIGTPDHLEVPFGLNAKTAARWEKNLIPEREAWYKARYQEVEDRIDEIKANVKLIDKSFDQTLMPKDVTAYRAINVDQYGDITKLKGSVIRDEGYTSTTITTKIRDHFIEVNQGRGHDPAVVRVFIPKGSKVIPVDGAMPGAGNAGWEEELLLPRGSMFRVLNVGSNKDGLPMIDVELIV